jgi:hypothetical protein
MVGERSFNIFIELAFAEVRLVACPGLFSDQMDF